VPRTGNSPRFECALVTVTADMGTAGRDRWLRLYPVALGMGGLGGAWRTAIAYGAPAWPARYLAAVCLGGWLFITCMYMLRGRGDPRAFIADLRHPEQGFALGYIPVIPMLLVAQAAPRTSAFCIIDLVLVALWATATAALVAHWITTPRDRHAIHPGFSLPVVAGPFIACISLQANGLHSLAIGLFGIGGFFWIVFGTVIVGRLMTEQPLTDARFPTLVTLMVPPATASIALFTLTGNRISTAGIGLAAVLAMMALIQLFILPEYLRRPFTMSSWVFSFPLAATANTAGHWAVASSDTGVRVLAWLMLTIATTLIGVLAVLTIRLVWRRLGKRASVARIVARPLKSDARTVPEYML
jgi:tellurite resistance protein